MKRFTIQLIFVILFVSLFAFISHEISSKLRLKIDSFELKYSERIGSEVVINKDTFLIIDYSILNNNFTLSNGQKISFDLISKIQKIPLDKDLRKK